MSILVNKDNKVIVYGISGKYGSNQVKAMLKYGTNIVAGITPGKGGTEEQGVPVYDTLAEAMEKHEINSAIIYVPPMNVKDAAFEAIGGGLRFIMIAAEGVPQHDTMLIKQYAKEKECWVLGPNTIGMITPGECLIGSLAAGYAKKGSVGLVSRGGTIAIEVIRMLSEAGIGLTTAIGAGGDKVIGRNPAEYLKLFEQDRETKAVVLIGEIGGQKENECAEIIKTMTKPVYVYILGRTAPQGARMGHIGTIVAGDTETFEAKREIARKAGAIVVDTPWQLIDLLNEAQIS